MDKQRIKIRTEDCHTKVFINDTEIKGVRELTFHQSVEEAPVIKIELLAINTEFEMEAVDIMMKEENYEP